MSERVEEWEWDDANVGHLARHELTPQLVKEIGNGRPLFRTNLRERAATHQMVGPDIQQRIWVICILECPGRPGRWRAITGWRATRRDQDWYWRHV